MKISDVKRATVEKWLAKFGITKFIINDDLTVDVNESVMISSRMNALPIQFGTIRGNFGCVGNKNITTFKGFPHTIHGNFSCAKNKISSFEFSPSYVSGVYSCSQNNFETLHDIQKHIRHVGEDIHCGQQFFGPPTHILGLFRIKDLKHAFVGIPELNVIVNKCLKEGKDALLCQEELIAAGFEDYAEF